MDVLMSETSIQVLNRGAVLSDVGGIGGDIGRVPDPLFRLVSNSCEAVNRVRYFLQTALRQQRW